MIKGPEDSSGSAGSAEAPRRPLKQEQEPASSEITEVSPGVLRLQIPIFFTGLGHVNCYALLDDRGATVVDAGMPGRATWQALTRRLRDAGLRVRDVHTVIVTHSHPDHFGCAGTLASEAGAELITERHFHTWLEPKSTRSRAGSSAHGHRHGGGPDACAQITSPEAVAVEGDSEADDTGVTTTDDTGYLWATRTTPWGGSPIPHLNRSIWMMRLARWHLIPRMRPPIPTRLVNGGDHLKLAGREWKVVFTPGHTGDHVCLFDLETKLLISGDHVLPTITPHVPGLSPLADPLGSYLESLRGLRRLGDVTLVLPAHGHPFGDLSGRIDQIIAHHDDRLAELRQISAALGPATVVDLSRELFRPAVWGMMAESETYAHLEYLRLRGQAERLELEGQVGYRVEAAPAPMPESPTAH